MGRCGVNFFLLWAVFLGDVVWGRPPTIREFLTEIPDFSLRKPSMVVVQQDNNKSHPYEVKSFFYQVNGNLDDVTPKTQWRYSKHDGTDALITLQQFKDRVLGPTENDDEDWSVSDFIQGLTVYQFFDGLGMLDDPVEVSCQDVWVKGRNEGPYNQSFGRVVQRKTFLLSDPFYDPKVPLSISGQFSKESVAFPSRLFEHCLLLLMAAYYVFLPLILTGDFVF